MSTLYKYSYINTSALKDLFPLKIFEWLLWNKDVEAASHFMHFKYRTNFLYVTVRFPLIPVLAVKPLIIVCDNFVVNFFQLHFIMQYFFGNRMVIEKAPVFKLYLKCIKKLKMCIFLIIITSLN